MPEYNPRRGRDVVEEAAEKRGGGEFKPFCPEHSWKDSDEKFVLILTEPDALAEALLHEWVKVGTFTNRNGEVKPKFEWFLSRKDRGLGEGYDELEERLGNQPKLRIMGVGVELVPVVEAGRGGKKTIAGFEVATTTFNRKGDDDELEEVTQPEIGVITQASANFWKPLCTFDTEYESIHDIAFRIVRNGGDANTSYTLDPMRDKPVDLSGILEYIDGVTYLTTRDDFDEVIAEAEAADDDLAAAMVIADALLWARLRELADKERYDALVKPIEHLEQKFGKKKKATKKAEPRKARPRRSAKAETETEAKVEEAPQTPEETRDAKGDRFAALRARAEKSAA